LASLTFVGQTGAELPPWPPLSPAVAAPAVATAHAEDPPPADSPEVAAPDEGDGQPEPLPGVPVVRAPRSRLRFAAVAAVAVLLVVSAVLLITPAHRPGRTATLTPPGTAPVPAPAGGTTGGPQPGTSGAASASGHPTPTAGASAPGATPPAGATPTGPGAPSTGPGAPEPPPADPVSATWSVTVHNGPDPGYRTDIVLTNQGATAVTGWQLVFALPSGETVTKADGAVYVQAGTLLTLTPKDPGQVLHAGQKITVRFEVKGSTAPPEGCTINGNPCG